MSDDRGDLGEVVVMEVDTANAKAIAQVLHVLRLARYFNTTPQSWLNLQKSYELELAKRTVGQAIEAEVSPRTA